MTGTSQLKRVTHRWWFRVLLLRVAVLTFPKISPSCASFTRVLCDLFDRGELPTEHGLHRVLGVPSGCWL